MLYLNRSNVEDRLAFTHIIDRSINTDKLSYAECRLTSRSKLNMFFLFDKHMTMKTKNTHKNQHNNNKNV